MTLGGQVLHQRVLEVTDLGPVGLGLVGEGETVGSRLTDGLTRRGVCHIVVRAAEVVADGAGLDEDTGRT